MYFLCCLFMVKSEAPNFWNNFNHRDAPEWSEEGTEDAEQTYTIINVGSLCRVNAFENCCHRFDPIRGTNFPLHNPRTVVPR